MTDDEYVAELLAILTNPHPKTVDPDNPYSLAVDRIDRHDGFGRDVIVTALDVVPGEHGDELLVTFALALPAEPTWKLVPAIGTTSLAFDAEWRDLSGFGTPDAYAPWVARETQKASRRHVRRYTASPAEHAYRPRVPPREDQWPLVLELLGREGEVREAAPGRIEVAGRGLKGEPVTVTVVITPEEWELILTYGIEDDISETFELRDPDELFLVVYRGELTMSTREQLPPVRGSFMRRRADEAMARAREKNPDAEFGWFAFAPLAESDQSD